MQKAMVLIGDKKYYTVEEAATLAGVSVRTLRRWISAGRLSDFIYPFRASPSEVLYRLEEPEEGDMKNARGEYVLPKGSVPAKGSAARGGGADEGGSVT